MSFDTLTPINCGVLHPNQGELVLGGADGKLRIWDLAADKCCAELVRATAAVARGKASPHTARYSQPFGSALSLCSPSPLRATGRTLRR